MNLMKVLATNSYCYKEMPNMSSVKGIIVHSTGCNNPNIRRYVGPDNGLIGKPSSSHWNQYYINGKVHKTMVHAFIGKLKDGSIATVQIQEWSKKCYHCGTGPTGKSGNTNYISFEICEDNLGSRDYFNKVYREAVELCAYLCTLYPQIDPLKNILCHSEAHDKGFASNHADVMHWFPKYGKSMDTFRVDVYNELKKLNKEEEEMNQAKFDEFLTNSDQFDKMVENYLNKRADYPGAEWSKTFRDAAVESGLIAGDTSGRMMWQSFLTREQLATILYRAGIIK